MAGYVIRGGEEGKARLSIIGAALGTSTADVLAAAGLREGLRALDVGCGGGDVSLAMGRVVGPSGQVVGIDMDPVKIDLGRQDAADEGLDHVELRVGDATALDVVGGFDLVYARFLLTHLIDPRAALHCMVAAAAPGGMVIVEDLDHDAVFGYPACPALARYLTLYAALVRSRGGNPVIGPTLPALLREAGLEDVRLRLVQPAFMVGPAKRIHVMTLENVRDGMLGADLVTEEELATVAAEMEAHVEDPHTIVAFPRIYQVFGRRPE